MSVVHSSKQMSAVNFAEWEIKSAWMGSGFARDVCASWLDWNEGDFANTKKYDLQDLFFCDDVSK